MELKDELLWENAETLAVPSCEDARVPRIVRQLTHCVAGILARTVEYLKVQNLLRLATCRAIVWPIHLSLRFFLMRR